VTHPEQLNDDLYDEPPAVQEDPYVEELPLADELNDDRMELEEDDLYEEPAEEYFSPRHNEIEDFLL
jgi:hypothetical protein